MPSKGLSIAIYFFISLALGPVVRRNAGFLDSGVITKLPTQSPKGLRHTVSTTSSEAIWLSAQFVALGPVVVLNTPMDFVPVVILNTPMDFVPVVVFNTPMDFVPVVNLLK